ncbi:MAG: glycosyltransferase family 2 protein [Flavobacteriales bacterium]|nr:glycosyltransferase family 2 protein [Flavobacteriales bacterium]
MNKKVATIIVTYNGSRWIKECLKSIKQSDYYTDIFLIDNNSTDNTLEIVSEFKDINIIKSKENLGFGKANNLGIQKVLELGYEYFFLVNQDVYVEKETVKKLVQFSNNTMNLGIISPIHYLPNGNLDENFQQYLKKSKEYNSFYESSFLNAACWLVTKECIEKVGLFHRLFYHYGEDRNYCDRVLYHNLKIIAVKNTKIIHDRDEKESLEKALRKCPIYLKTIFLNPNFSTFESVFQGFKSVLGVSKYYYRKYKSTRFFFVLSSSFFKELINLKKYQKLKYYKN